MIETGRNLSHPEAGRPSSRINLDNFAEFAHPDFQQAVAGVYVGKLRELKIRNLKF